MSQFVKAVCRTMERIAPLRLAESWDNVGLLVEAPPKASTTNKVLLTIDLTSTVALEAIQERASMVIAYHPPIFRPLSSLTLANPIQRSILQLAQEGISVYSPHTALDSVKGGINDWLAEAFKGLVDSTRPPSYLQEKDDDEGGAGRLLILQTGLTIEEITGRVKSHLGIEQVQVAPPVDFREHRDVTTIAICAGSGGSMLQGVDADIYFTGEMQHHEVLAAQSMNRYILLCGHTNTERGYLKVLREKLLARATEEDLASLEVVISKSDKHPLFSV